MREIYRKYGVKVTQFSEIHFRIEGLFSVDYWPSTGRVWITGSKEAFEQILEPWEAMKLAQGDYHPLPEGAAEHMSAI